MTCYVCVEQSDLRRCDACTTSFCARCWVEHLLTRGNDDGLCNNLVEYATTYAQLRLRREHEQQGYLLEEGDLYVPDEVFVPEEQDFAAALVAYQSSMHLRRDH